MTIRNENLGLCTWGLIDLFGYGVWYWDTDVSQKSLKQNNLKEQLATCAFSLKAKTLPILSLNAREVIIYNHKAIISSSTIF